MKCSNGRKDWHLLNFSIRDSTAILGLWTVFKYLILLCEAIATTSRSVDLGLKIDSGFGTSFGWVGRHEKEGARRSVQVSGGRRNRR